MKYKLIFSDIPLFPGAERKCLNPWFFWWKTKQYHCKAKITDVVSFYKKVMPELGWQLVDEEKPLLLKGQSSFYPSWLIPKHGQRIASLGFRKKQRKVFISLSSPPGSNEVTVNFAMVPPCPFELGDKVEFRPRRRFASVMQGHYEEQGVHPGYVGKVTEIKNDMTVYLDNHRAGFPWGEFRLVEKVKKEKEQQQ